MREAKKRATAPEFSGKVQVRGVSRELHARLAELAAKNRRSMQGEMLYALESYARAESGRKAR
jgi:predicted HicB family RNase H-like nuclease